MDSSKYFYRIALYTREGEQVSVVDALNPGMSAPLDPWLGTVLSLADGQHTLGELVGYLAGRYAGNPPAELEKTVASVVDRLLESKAMELADAPVNLPYYLALPVNEQDLDKSRQMMLDDGYIQH